MKRTDAVQTPFYHDTPLGYGFAKVEKTDDGIYMLKQIEARPQDKGIGSELLEIIENYVRKNGGGVIITHAEDKATGFYTKCVVTSSGVTRVKKFS